MNISLTISPLQSSTEPGMPRNLMLVERTNVSLFITWDEPVSDGGSDITDYRVQIQNQKTNAISSEFVGDVREHNITNLNPFTTYSIRVAAINSEGRGDPIIIEEDTLSNSTCCKSFVSISNSMYLVFIH